MFAARTLAEYFIQLGANSTTQDIIVFLRASIVTAVYASGSPENVSGETIGFIGVVWFMVALFVARTMYDYLHLKLRDHPTRFLLTISVLSVIGVCIGQIQYLPLSFDVALAALPLLYVGKEFDRFRVENRPAGKLLLFTAAWILLFLATNVIFHCRYFSYAFRQYDLFPICYVTAVAGTLAVAEFSVLMAKLRVSKPMLYLGKNSIYMLCVHMADYSLPQIWRVTYNPYINSLFRIAMNVVMFVCVMLVVERIKKIRAGREPLLIS